MTRKLALLIGISKYTSTEIGEAKYAREDAVGVRDALHKHYGFNLDDEIILMTCEQSGLSPNYPSRNHILDCLTELKRYESDNLELLLVGFWGHGILNTDGLQDERYLCAIDTNKRNFVASGIARGDVIRLAGKVRAQHTCLILDCCQTAIGPRSVANPFSETEHNKMLKEAENATRDIVAARRDKGYEDSVPSTFTIWHSCSPKQSAYPCEDSKHGLFTAHLIAGLNQRLGSLNELSSYVSREFFNKTRHLRIDQTPTISEMIGLIPLPVVGTLPSSSAPQRKTPKNTGTTSTPPSPALPHNVEPLIKRRKEISKFYNCIAAGPSHTVGLTSNGTVLAVGDNSYGQCNVLDWRGIVAVAIGNAHTVGVKSDGTVLAVGDNSKGQCNVLDWQDIIAVAAGISHTVGVKSDGTVLAVGDNSYGQCNALDWQDVVAVAAGHSHTVGLTSNGTAFAAGCNNSGQCNVGGWRDIVAVAASHYSNHTVGLKSDGTVLAVGQNSRGECNVLDWRGIVAVAAGAPHIPGTVGVKSDGTIVMSNPQSSSLVKSWQDIVAIAIGSVHIFGVKSDGTAIATTGGSATQNCGQNNVIGWCNLGMRERN